MSFQEKSAVVSLLANVFGYIVYFGEVFRRFLEGDVGSGGELAFWAAAILIFIPVITIIKVIVHVIFVVINTITRGEKDPEITDEFDRLIELKGVRNFCYVFMAGFMLAMVTLAATNQPVSMFVVLLFTIMAAGTALDASMIVFYRRGA